MFEKPGIFFRVEDKKLEFTINYDVIDRIQCREKTAYFVFVRNLLETDDMELFEKLLCHIMQSAIDIYNEEHEEKVVEITEEDIENNVQDFVGFKSEILKMIIDTLPDLDSDDDFAEEDTGNEEVDIAYLFSEARRIFHYSALEFRKETPRNFWNIYVPYLKMCGRLKEKKTIDDIIPF